MTSWCWRPARGCGACRCRIRDLQGIHGLRTIDDALAIAGEFRKGRRLVVVGGGFIGLETAAAARSAGLEASVVEASDRLLARLVPPAIGQLLARRHRAAGVARTWAPWSSSSSAMAAAGSRRWRCRPARCCPATSPSSGSAPRPETELAVAAGLEVDGGGCASMPRCAPTIRRSSPAATWRRSGIRSMSGMSASRPGRMPRTRRASSPPRSAAKTRRYDTVPWFWSDQYELSLQIAGLPQLGSGAVQRRSPDGAVIQFHLDPAGRLVGATGLGRAEAIGRDIRLARELIAERAAHPALGSALRDPPRSRAKGSCSKAARLSRSRRTPFRLDLDLVGLQVDADRRALGPPGAIVEASVVLRAFDDVVEHQPVGEMGMLVGADASVAKYSSLGER